MAVRTHNIAIGDFREHALPVPITKTLANRERFVCDVVELQDDGIAFTAVGTWVCAQELQQIGNPLLANDSLPATCPFDVKLSIRCVVRLRVPRSAAPTVGTAFSGCLPAPDEFLDWLDLAAAPASPDLLHRTSVRKAATLIGRIRRNIGTRRGGIDCSLIPAPAHRRVRLPSR